MKIIEFIRLVRKHLLLLLLVSCITALLMVFLTRNSTFMYTSKTTLYTGLVTGTSVEMDKTFNYSITNTTFDNLINIIKSRKTQQDVAIRLLSQHLLLDKPDPKFISASSFAELKEITPDYVKALVVKKGSRSAVQPDTTSTIKKDPDSLFPSFHDQLFTDSTTENEMESIFPPQINRDDYEATVRNLTDLMNSNDTNFVYKLLNFTHPHYSIAAMATVKAERINSSDLIRLSYEVDDPGICQQTLATFNEVCISNYRSIKENRSDAVVKYFQNQLKLADQKLRSAEEKLLSYNKNNNIINYNEQSRAIVTAKEDMSADYNNKKALLAGYEASASRLERKLNIQQQLQLNSATILDKKKQLGELNFQLASISGSDSNSANINRLRKQADGLKEEIRKSVDDLYSFQHTTDGLPVSKVLTDWLSNVVEAESLRARLKVMEQSNSELERQYAIYAPAGANIKRIEREIAVSEQGYLEFLHGLNTAKLKQQDNELAANIKAVDPPYYPISPIPNKRKVIVIAVSLISSLLVLGVIMSLEYFDETLKNLKRAGRILKIPAIGLIPKIFLNPATSNFSFIQERLLESCLQQMEQFLDQQDAAKITRTILFISTQTQEGKTVIAGNLARRLSQMGKKVLLLNYAGTQEQLTATTGFPLLSRILGYTDTRIDPTSPFLENPEQYLKKGRYVHYSINEDFYSSRTYTDLLDQQELDIAYTPDYVFIELPAILTKNYPARLLSNADMSLLICRANRIWSESDQLAINSIRSLTGDKLHFMINGTELKEVETVIGDLPKKRSVLRKKIKNLFRFQFFSNNRI
jgi:succinoglycan biosynthesis transport protein ExoP